MLPVITFDRQQIGEPATLLEREWLVSNGIGGYAGASLSGALTRRYHGLLVAATQPPLGRTVLLGKLEETLVINGRRMALDVNEWQGGAASLSGLDYLQTIRFQGTLPSFVYRIEEYTLTKTVWQEYGLNTTFIRYSLVGPPGQAALEVRPLVNSRDYHGNTTGQTAPYRVEAHAADCWQVQAGDNQSAWRLLALGAAAEWRPAEAAGWYRGFYYRQENRRGLDDSEDMYCPGAWRITLETGQAITFAATTGPAEHVRRTNEDSYEREIARQAALLKAVPARPAGFEDLAGRLTLAADQFIVGRPDPPRPGQLVDDYRTVLAGYHWFGDWGRDTMIALPGLTLTTGRYSEAATILRTFARYVDRGMLPNRFPEAFEAGQRLDEGEYNTVDATLWYFDAVARYSETANDQDLARELYPVLKDIIAWHERGTRFGIRLDADGLLLAGAPGAQLTWMDVKIGERVITPRHGKPVEIQALWYRACRVAQQLAGLYGQVDEEAHFRELAERAAAAFEPAFWYAAGGYLYDVIGPDGQPDPALRPNQVIALAVAPELVARPLRQAALTRVKERLLTPYGLRSLEAGHPQYKPEYKGGRVERDEAYHQGTVWTWPLGPYARAWLNSFEPLPARTHIRQLLEPFRDHLNQAAIGQVNEIFGAEPPFPPVGCVAQAWSVSELLVILEMLAK